MRCWRETAVIAVLLALYAGPAAAQRTALDRVAAAVDGAESSHGQNLAMWRPDPSGPQGPMQVTAAAATDVGGGDRFDTVMNRAIGRAYLAALYRRYQNWPDAIAAYNWGIGRLNGWLLAGRPTGKLAKGVAAYTDRVLHDSGLCAAEGQPPGRLGKPRWAARSRHRAPGEAGAADERLGAAICTKFAGDSVALGIAKWRNDNRLLVGLLPPGFFRDLEAALRQPGQDLQAAAQRSEPLLLFSRAGRR
jgi:hypothetical protein